MNQTIKTIFIGTPDFAVPFLTALIADPDFLISAIITQPDRPVGRKQILTPPPVKSLAEANEIPVFQPEILKNNHLLISEIKKLEPDLIIVVAFGQIIPQDILDLAKLGCINVHPSLLPKYRGASPVQAAILAGDKETGISIILMDAKMDHGPILDQLAIDLSGNETNESLHALAGEIGPEFLIKTTKKFLAKEITPKPQDDTKAIFCSIIDKEHAKIHWSQPAEIIERQIRAFYPWPVSWTSWQGKKIKIFPSVKIKKSSELGANKKTGEVFLDGKDLAVACGNNYLVIDNLQMEGKNAMTGEEFVRGNGEIVNDILD